MKTKIMILIILIMRKDNSWRRDNEILIVIMS
jgi:hypothetical protein